MDVGGLDRFSRTRFAIGADPPALRVLTFLAMALAAIMLVIWLWSRACIFPSVPWNDMRLAPAVALAKGILVYPTEESGVINTWTYGPLPLLVYALASLAPTPASALMIAAFINMAIIIVPVACVCWLWPTKTSSPATRWIAFCLCIALWPEMFFSTLFSDTLAIACGLISNLFVIRASRTRNLWMAALISTAAVACKQTAIGIPVAQVLWLGMTTGKQAAIIHAGRCAIAGAAIGAAAITGFGWRGLWFTIIELPGNFGWRGDVAQQLKSTAPDLVIGVILPLVVMGFGRRRFARAEFFLPTLMWVCTLPLGLLALMKPGGWTNSLHSHLLWMPPVMTSLLAEAGTKSRRNLTRIATVLLTTAIASGRVLVAPHLPLRPQTDAYHDAQRFTPQLQGRVWFPMSPVITLYSDGRYYHDEDGLHVRNVTRKPTLRNHVGAHLPHFMHVIALRNDWSDWGIARAMMPSNAHVTTIGKWTLIDGARRD